MASNGNKQPASAERQTVQAAFPRLYETFADGRLANVYYRREQLAKLRDALVQAKDAILDGISKDSGYTLPETFAELYLTLAAIKQYHDDIDPQRELDTEYSIAKGRDAPQAHSGVGVVVIVPQAHNLVYSALVPLSSAIAAGNCTVLVLEQTLQSLPAVLGNVISQAIDPEIFVITSRHNVYDAAQGGSIQVVQTGSTEYLGVPNVLLSPHDSLSVAVVDRTADVNAAAKAIVDARMRFGGRSPYAPDLVLINEFAKSEFLNAVVRHAIRYMAQVAGPNDPPSLTNGVPKRQGDAVSANGRAGPNAPSRAGIKLVTSSSDVSIFDVVNRNALSSVGKVSSPSLYIHGIRSLDDAIEVANDASGGETAAAYVFGDLKTCKYLLEFIGNDAGFANQIPFELLVGPVAPRGTGVSFLTRFPTRLFTVPRPKFVQKTALSCQIDRLLEDKKTTLVAQQSVLLDAIKLQERAPVRHIEGYFETAALVGLTTIATPVLITLATVTFFGVRRILNR